MLENRYINYHDFVTKTEIIFLHLVLKIYIFKINFSKLIVQITCFCIKMIYLLHYTKPKCYNTEMLSSE